MQAHKEPVPDLDGLKLGLQEFARTTDPKRSALAWCDLAASQKNRSPTAFIECRLSSYWNDRLAHMPHFCFPPVEPGAASRRPISAEPLL